MNKELFDSIISGAIFEFAAWLATREEQLTISNKDDDVPVADAVAEFLKRKNISYENCDIENWDKIFTNF